MPLLTLLRVWIMADTLVGHKARVGALLSAVGSLLKGDVLTLTMLGRNRDGKAESKHKIKAMDRLLGNQHLYRERRRIYSSLAATLLANIKRPLILVDWADAGVARNDKLVVLGAAVPVKGRAMVIYEEVHPEKKYNNDKVHRSFIRTLMELLPKKCKPIVVTDAGFRVPWYQDVMDHGGHFLGRVRGKVKYLDPETKDWSEIKALYPKATARIKYVGHTFLTNINQFSCNLYIVRGKKRKTGRKGSAGSNCKNVKYRIMHKTPWLLATSIPHGKGIAKLVKRIYTKRMQIEESFRDLKSHRYGFGLRDAYTKNPERGSILLLIAALATFALWILGAAGTMRGLTRHFQSNTIKDRAVLSIVYLGKELWKNQKYKFDLQKLDEALGYLKQMVIGEAEYAVK